MMNDVFYLNDLFDIYGELLTDRQRDYFKDYYFNNMSYGEIALKYNISRNAIYKQLGSATEKLNELEDILNIYKNNKKIREIINNCSDKKIIKKKKKIINCSDKKIISELEKII